MLPSGRIKLPWCQNVLKSPRSKMLFTKRKVHSWARWSTLGGLGWPNYSALFLYTPQRTIFWAYFSRCRVCRQEIGARAVGLYFGKSVSPLENLLGNCRYHWSEAQHRNFSKNISVIWIVERLHQRAKNCSLVFQLLVHSNFFRVECGSAQLLEEKTSDWNKTILS